MLRAFGAVVVVTASLLAAPASVSGRASAGPASAGGKASAAARAGAAEEVEQVVNGGFEGGTAPWWFSAGAIEARDGQACVAVPGGTVNKWDVSVGQNDISLVAGENYRFSFRAAGTYAVRAITGLAVTPYDTYFEASPVLTGAGGSYEYTFTAAVTTDQAQVAFQLGGSATPWEFCVDDVSLVGGVPPEVYEPDTGPRVRVNQVGYLPGGPQRATLVTGATAALPWQVNDSTGKVVKRGTTQPRGVDVSSGQNVHSIDFSGLRGGKGYTLTADGETSRAFDVGKQSYQQLSTDSLKFFYTQRSGIAIDDTLRPGYGRPAGHVDVAPNLGDGNVPCQAGVCDYTLDVRGGWYDAGDHGKYVVNGGISTWQVLSAYERNGVSATLGIPESGNGVPDVLDEARWELEFLLKMQAPSGMVHHKIHDRAWTGLPLLPHLDPQPRELHPVSTAATLNLAAAGAQAARIYRRFDPAFAARALAAAKAAFTAAKSNPVILAPESDGVGGGAYNDTEVADDFSWAAAELYLTTGDQAYTKDIRVDAIQAGAFDWAATGAAGLLDLATLPNKLPQRTAIRNAVISGADRYLAAQKASAYGIPYSGEWVWGSNSVILNNMAVLATAHDLTGRAKYRDGVLEGMDYLLGRNALNQSYVTGYGEVSSHNQHSRWYAHELDPALPNPPTGSLSGGANSSIQDPYAQSKLTGCVGQFCYIDDIQSWSTNELTINWNSALAWVVSWIVQS